MPQPSWHSSHLQLRVPAQAQCHTCVGHGNVGVYECWRYAGEGAISGEYPVMINFSPNM